MQPVLSPIARISATSSSLSTTSGQRGELGALLLDRPRRRASWISVGTTRCDGRVGEVPLAGELQRREPVALGDRAHPLDPLPARLDPARGPERAVVALAERARADVAVEQPAVVDDARDQLHVVARAAGSTSSPGHGSSGLRITIAQSIAVAEALEAVDEVEREPVRRARAPRRSAASGRRRAARPCPPTPPRTCSPCGRGCAAAAGRTRRRRCAPASARPPSAGSRAYSSGPAQRGSVKRGKPFAPWRSPS